MISKPYDPVHVTHVGFDFQTGKCASRRFLYCCVFLTHDCTQKTPVCLPNGNKSLTTTVSPKTNKNETRTASWQSCST